jgi:hypothetical protein
MAVQGFNGAHHHYHLENMNRLQMNSLDCTMTYYHFAGSLHLAYSGLLAVFW